MHINDINVRRKESEDECVHPYFQKLWGQKGNVSFSKVEDNILMSSFTHTEDRERALKMALGCIWGGLF